MYLKREFNYFKVQQKTCAEKSLTPKDYFIVENLQAMK